MTDLVILCHSLPQAVFGDVDWLQSLDGALHRDVLAPQVLCKGAVVFLGPICFFCCAGVQGATMAPPSPPHVETRCVPLPEQVCPTSPASLSPASEVAPGLYRCAVALPGSRQAELHCQYCCSHQPVAHMLRDSFHLQPCEESGLPGAPKHQQCMREVSMKCKLFEVTCHHSHLQPGRLPGAAAPRRCMRRRCPAEPAAPAAGRAGLGCPCAACWRPHLQSRSNGFSRWPAQMAWGCQTVMLFVLVSTWMRNVHGLCCTERP